MTIDHFEIFIVKPKASVNLCTNPSFETGTTGWSAQTNSTISINTTLARRGVRRLLIAPTHSTSNNGARYQISLTAGVTYTFSVDVRALGGFTYRVEFLDSSFNPVATKEFTPNGTVFVWIRESVTYTPSSSGTYHVRVQPYGNMTNFYIDGAQIEIGSEPTTYFDGDSEGFTNERNEIWWDAAKHASISYRSEFSQAGGELIPISDYCKRIGVYGLGMSPTKNVSVELSDGSKRYLYSNTKSRYFTIQVSFTDLSVGEIDAKRLALLNLINPQNRKFDQPMLLKFIGYDSNNLIDSKIVDVKCSYVSGLEQSPQTNKPYIADITFEMFDKTMEIEGDISVPLQMYDSYNAIYLFSCIKNDGSIYDCGGFLLTIGGIYPQRINQNPVTDELWFVGDFVNFGGTPSKDYCLKFAGFGVADPFVKPMTGTEPNGIVYDVTFDFLGRAFIVGAFTGVGGVATNYMARINTDGSVTGITGMTGTGKCITNASNGYLYIGGNSIRQLSYNSTSTSLVDGTKTDVRIIRQDNVGEIYYYNHADLKIYKGVSGGVAIGTFNNEVMDIAFDDNNNLYAVGKFTTIDGNTSNYFGIYDGNVWKQFTGVFDGYVLSIQNVDGKMLVSGSFNYYGSDLFNYICWYENGIFKPYPLRGALASASYFYDSYIDKSGHLWGMGQNTTPFYLAINDVVNSGNDTYPKFKIRNNSTSSWNFLQLYNHTTKKLIYCNDIYVRGYDVLTIDTKDGSIEIFDGFGQSKNRFIVRGSDYDFYLKQGENRLIVSVNGSPDEGFMIYRECIDSLDGWLQ